MILPGSQLGPYYIDRELGRGGMAWVYHAIDERTGGEIALKVLPPHHANDNTLLRRFQQESELAVRLRHANIVRAHEHGEIDGYFYIALEYAVRGTLTMLLRQRNAPIPLEETVQILRRVALALDYAHSRGVLHRDVKPSNILVGANGQIWLTDFGMARRMDSDMTIFSSSNQTLGTPAYMSPEQIRNPSRIDSLSDLYSLGVVAYQMLTRRMPFEATSPMTLMRQITDELPTPPQQVNTRLSEGVCYILERMLSKQPDARYPTGGAFIDALVDGNSWVPTKEEWAKVRRRVSATKPSRRQVEESPFEATSLYVEKDKRENDKREKNKRRTSRTATTRTDALQQPVTRWIAFGGIGIAILALLFWMIQISQ